MEEATTIGYLTCFTGNIRAKNQPNRLLIESVPSKLELLPGYEKLPHDPSPIISKAYAIMPHEMRQSSGGWKRLKWNILGTNFGSGIDADREEGGDKVMKGLHGCLMPMAKGGWA